ncbi:zf-HC2 domain-containing protein [Rhodohalobacter mucosus]|uniref:Uncharacterized protein n=1 Tax=Rhodohalobacter mucosus TaxID=2079485 RepID=A0A316TUT9_9BACT|nr:zf-HC2 domain-containing protein [Rhodohalobacter mucosus]PWN07039.1 hypothetical protein DDZ15_07150 [Rhodohalobacter mucosus]
MNTQEEHVKSLFLDWSENKLSEADSMKVDHHLNECENCASYFKNMQFLFNNPQKEQLPVLEMDPYLPVRIKSTKADSVQSLQSSSARLRNTFLGALIVSGILIGFLLGQQLVYTAYYSDRLSSYENVPVEWMYYEGIAQPGLGSRYEHVISEIEDEEL